MTNGRNCRQAIVAIAMILPVFALFAERQPCERYQSVVDRQMFGAPPPGFDPTKNPSEISAKDERAKDQELTKEQEQVKSAIHFSMVNVTPAGDTAVGFTDNSDAKSPKHYYLKVGESRDGWTVKEADALAATMTIAKGEIEVSLTLGGDSASGGGTKRVAGGQKAGANAFGSRSPYLTNGRTGSPSRTLGSLRERRALREKQREEAAKVAAEEKRMVAEREAQREAERAAEKAEREKEREAALAEKAEMRKKMSEMMDELRKQREESVAKQETEESADGGDNKGDGE